MSLNLENETYPIIFSIQDSFYFNTIKHISFSILNCLCRHRQNLEILMEKAPLTSSVATEIYFI